MPSVMGMPLVRAADRTQWRAWLRDNCESAGEVWLVIQHVRSAIPGIGRREAVEEALCFGWIDSVARGRDADSWYQRFSPRNPRSAWSNLNRRLVEQLTEQGLMTPHGQAAVDLAKRTGTWLMLADAQNGVVPHDLREQLDAVETAATGFDAYSRSQKQAILGWIASAKRPETRQRRITRTIEAAARNLRPNKAPSR
jgi:uncharacterized protein YdeI (YjbR/CyaY-like superfamily)